MVLKKTTRRPETLLFLILFGFLLGLTLQIRRDDSTLFNHAALRTIAPFLRVYNSTSHLMTEGLEAYFWQRDAAVRAERLELENRTLKGQILAREHLVRENETLRGLLSIPIPESIRPVGGRVLSLQGAPFRRYLLVSLSPDLKVPELTPVITPDGVVGRMAETAEGLVQCLLLTDPSSSIGVAAERSGVHGVATGRGEGRMALRWISNEADVRVGDLIVTSGNDGVFPPGIPVGRVVSSVNEPNYLKNVDLEPVVNLNELKWVLLLIEEDA